MNRYSLLLALLLAMSPAWGAEPGTGNVAVGRIVLYQPDEVLQQRLASVQELAAYIQGLQSVLNGALGSSKTAEALDVVVIVKPGKKSRVWFVSSLPKAPDRTRLAKELQAVPALSVKEGPIAFAISLNIAGATRTDGPNGFSPPMPKEWKKANQGSKQPLTIPDGIVEKLWKD